MNRILTSLLTLALMGQGLAQVTECDFTYTLTYGCSKDGTGYATITGLDPEGYFEIRWDGNEATGGPQVTGLASGQHSVAIFNGTDCEAVETFVIDCSSPPITVCQFRTQTQGGWGTSGNGGNPGAYRNAYFATAFPNGLQIGCTNKLRLTSSTAVQAFLPSGTSARQLNPGTLVNPGSSYRNVLAGQLVALTLSVGFDAVDHSFGQSTMALGNAIIQSGPFQGWTVQSLLNEANRFIGGCGSSYTAAQLNSALSMANECFVDGTANTGFLGCTMPGTSKALNSADELRIYPNPANDRVVVELPAMGTSRLEIFDATGRNMYQMNVAPTERTLQLNTAQLPQGAYLIRSTTAQGQVTRRINVVH